MPDDVSSRILAVATLAEQAAAEATPGPWSQDAFYVVGQVPEGRPGGEVIVQCKPTRDGMASYPSRYPYGPQARANARLIAASGPSHWGAVAQLLRITVTEGYIVQELLDLADQIFRDLGGES